MIKLKGLTSDKSLQSRLPQGPLRFLGWRPQGLRRLARVSGAAFLQQTPVVDEHSPSHSGEVEDWYGWAHSHLPGIDQSWRLVSLPAGHMYMAGQNPDNSGIVADVLGWAGTGCYDDGSNHKLVQCV